MSEFLKRWSSRKHQALQPRETVEAEALAPSVDSESLVSEPVLTADSGVVSTDKGSGEPLAIEGAQSGDPQLSTAQPGKPALPDREALRAIFRSHQPDGLDDYTQDFSKPELLPAALTAGLRNWLVDTISAPEAGAIAPSPAQAESGPVAPAAVVAEHQPPVPERDILAGGGGQNVSLEGADMAPSGS